MEEIILVGNQVSWLGQRLIRKEVRNGQTQAQMMKEEMKEGLVLKKINLSKGGHLINQIGHTIKVLTIEIFHI